MLSQKLCEEVTQKYFDALATLCAIEAGIRMDTLNLDEIYDMAKKSTNFPPLNITKGE